MEESPTCPECEDTSAQEPHGLTAHCHVCDIIYCPDLEIERAYRASWENAADALYKFFEAPDDTSKEDLDIIFQEARWTYVLADKAREESHGGRVEDVLPPGWRQMVAERAIASGLLVIACPAMTTPVEEIKAWFDYHNLSLSVSFADRVYNVDLRQPLGQGGSISIMGAKAADFAVALVAACESYERIHAQRTS